MTFTVFDVITLTIITVSSLFGLYRGFTQIFISLLGFVASIIGAFFLYTYVEPVFVDRISNELFASIFAGISCYVVSLIFFTFLTSKIILLTKESTGGIIDRTLGFIAGFIRGGIFAVIIFIVAAIITSGAYLQSENLRQVFLKLDNKFYPDWLAMSVTTKYYENATKNIVLSIPTEMLESIKLPATKKKDEEEEEQDLIDSIKKKKEENGLEVPDVIDTQVDEELEKSIDELGF